MEVQIITPAPSDDDISELLRNLTKMIVKRDPEKQVCGFFGGEYGYGCDIETPVFRMFPYYWGDCTCGFAEKEAQWSQSHSHAPECYWLAYRKLRDELEAAGRKTYGKDFERRAQALCKRYGIPWNNGYGSAVHCTCDYEPTWKAWSSENDHAQTCPVVIPNFLHKPSGAKVEWYKYIGRGMKVEAPDGFDWEACMRECGQSLEQHR